MKQSLKKIRWALLIAGLLYILVFGALLVFTIKLIKDYGPADWSFVIMGGVLGGLGVLFGILLIKGTFSNVPEED